MARDWRTTKTKTKREWSTLQDTPTQKTSSIPQPKCKKGIRLKYGAQQSENIGEKKPTVYPLTQGMTVPRHQSWSVSSCVIWGGWRGLGRRHSSSEERSSYLLAAVSCHVLTMSSHSPLGEQEDVRRRQAGSLKPLGKTSPVLPTDDHHAAPH